jgi:hypothetical protein
MVWLGLELVDMLHAYVLCIVVAGVAAAGPGDVLCSNRVAPSGSPKHQHDC